MVTEEDIGKYERFFRDPLVEDDVLTPLASGVACSNIRTALRMLGYDNDYGDRYDDEIAGLVLRFQTEQGHTSRDGAFGPGTRRLLTQKLLEEFGTAIFGRMVDPQPSYIFVSYKREDLPRIRPVLEDLQAWGYKWWFDDAIPGGAQWHAHVAEKVADCWFLLAFLSREAVESKWVAREIQFADSRDKQVVPVLLEPVELDSGLEMILAPYQMLDATRASFVEDLKWAIQNVR